MVFEISTGEYLDRLAAMYGVHRYTYETDHHLRIRILKEMEATKMRIERDAHLHMSRLWEKYKL